ncbi:hypothetical protein [Nubsella zeaxanthinifaciens]|uniref:hypothetical protein n=1 Tax=Nubsella zeaxanthinifaciens TaxID=392412 RepID=UPI000DE2959D|nr:hypothetical protein [Nubsella zeaxanthinifaciens]
MLQEDQNKFRPAKRRKQPKVALEAKKQTKKNAQADAPTNSIKSILFERGFKSVVPTDSVLQTLDITLHRFNKILDNKTELTLTEANSFAEWLGVTIEELSPAQSQNLPSKFGLKN